MKYECVIKCVCMSSACGITLMFTFMSALCAMPALANMPVSGFISPTL